MKTQTETKTETKMIGTDVPQYQIFRHEQPDLSDEEFESMRTVVCGWLFGARTKEAPTA